MDKDGDGSCSKDEYKEAYIKFMKDEAGSVVTDSEYEAVWLNIDKDNSGDVSVPELAEFYGFKLDKNGALIQDIDMMDDDAILEALKFSAHLGGDGEEEAAKQILAKQSKVKTPPEKMERVKAINLKTAPEDNLQKNLLEDAICGDVKEAMKHVEKMMEQKVSVRCENSETGQTALHMIAVFGDKPDAEKFARKYLEASGEKKDVNYTCKKLKSPLHVAASNGKANFVRMLLDKGADALMQDEAGSTALHAAVHSRDMPTLKAVLESDRVRMKKGELVKMTDTQGRAALHIASFKAEDDVAAEMVKMLLAHGADAKQADSGGMTAATLAGKSGRRKSRELLEAYT